MNDITDITIFGASARAACWSALRAGLKPRALDRFRDLDFPPGCDIQLISGNEQVLFETDEPQTEFCLPVGGWENDAETMRQLEAKYKLWNTDSIATMRARNPFLVQQILRDANLPSLNVRHAFSEHAFSEDDGGDWIRKPLAGTGGIGIERVLPTNNGCGPDCYAQQFVPGESHSAIFFASQESKAKLLGITQQIIGCEELPDRPFAYVGSIGPVLSGDDELEESIRWTLQQMANELGRQIHFYGLFCFDFIVSRNIPYLVEINPRYSASIEVLELALQQSFLQHFLNHGACRTAAEEVIGKSILYAWREMELSPDWDWNRATHILGNKPWNYDQWSVPVLSDLAAPGSRFSTGDPICTVWAKETTVQSCKKRLTDRTRKLRRILDAVK